MPPVTPPDEHFSRLGLILLAMVSLCWGLNWPVMKIVLAEIPPLYFRGSSLLVAGIILLVIARLGGNSIVIPKKTWGRLMLFSVFNISAWNIFITHGVSLMPSGRAALLGYTMPLWGSLLSVLILGERIVWQRFASLILGLTGIAVLMGDSLELRASAGTIYMLLAAWSWAIGIVLFKCLPLAIPTIALSGWSMALGSLPLLVAAIPLETSRLIVPSTLPILGWLYTVLFVFMLCQWAWNRVVLMVPVSVSSLSSLGTPLIGVVSGSIILGEPLGWQEALAAILILSSVGSVSLRR